MIVHKGNHSHGREGRGKAKLWVGLFSLVHLLVVFHPEPFGKWGEITQKKEATDVKTTLGTVGGWDAYPAYPGTIKQRFSLKQRFCGSLTSHCKVLHEKPCLKYFPVLNGGMIQLNPEFVRII